MGNIKDDKTTQREITIQREIVVGSLVALRGYIRETNPLFLYPVMTVYGTYGDEINRWYKCNWFVNGIIHEENFSHNILIQLG